MLRRSLAIPAFAAMAAAVFGVWSQMTGFGWTDYEDEALVPVTHLVHGQVSAFLTAAPAYGGSLLMRAPAAFLPSLWGGGQLAVYRMLAVPCLLAAMVLGLVLCRTREVRFPAAKGGAVIAVLAVCTPPVLAALTMGHPEELLGGALVVGAMLAALRQRGVLTAVLLGLAMANKAWAVVAVAPILIALERDRVKVLIGAGALAALFVLPFLIAGTTGVGGTAGVVAGATHTSTIFQPWQIWWPLGDLNHVVASGYGVKPHYRYPPGWISPIAHPLIVLASVPLAAGWVARRRGDRSHDLLLLLALILLVRCVLDPWNISYYHVPFLLALLAWEATSRERAPVFTLLCSVLIWLPCTRLTHVIAPDLQCALYLGFALPAIAVLGAAVYRLTPQPLARVTVVTPA